MAVSLYQPRGPEIQDSADSTRGGGSGGRAILWFSLIVVVVVGGMLYSAHLRRKRQREEWQAFAARSLSAGRDQYDARGGGVTGQALDEGESARPVSLRVCPLAGPDGAPASLPVEKAGAGAQAEARRLVAQAFELQQKDQVEPSLSLLDQAIGKDPHNPEAYFARGQGRARGSDVKDAEQDLLSALALRPGYPEALDNLTFLYLRAGCPDQALMAVRQLIDKHPEFHPERSYWLRATALQQKGDLRGALKDAERACAAGNQEACAARKVFKL